MDNDVSTARTATVDASLDERVLREHLASVYSNHRTTVLAHLGFATALAIFTLFHFRPQWVICAWLAALATVDLYALFTPRWTPAAPTAESTYWARKYTRLVTLISTATAFAPFFFVSATDLFMTTVLTVVIMGSWTRAVQARWPLRSAMFGYGIPMMSGLILALAWYGGPLNWFLAGFGAVNLVLTLRAGVQQNRRLTESLILRFENEALAARLKEQIEATERASAEKTRFLAAASHDLRQPMHAIALFGAAMQNALRDHPESRNAERLMRAVNTLGTSLDTMLDVSRLDAGIVVSDPRALELDALFLALNQTFAAQAEQRGLQLRVRASGLWVRSDLQLLYRMLSNLIDNALKYTRQGGVSVTARARGEIVWVEVRDTGIGIASEQLSRIFEEFYQIDNPGRDRARGLGIGLSIVKRLSRLLAHPVMVHSRPGRGTRFRLIVPATEPVDEAQTDLLLQDLESPVRHRFAAPELHGRILLIDDEAEIRVAMTELLSAYSVDVLAVADEAQAAEALASPDAKLHPFAMLLCDYRLAGGEDGLEAGLRLRERFSLEIPLLLITGETSPERLQRARASGMPMLFKPVSAAMLLQAMADLASAEVQQRAALQTRSDFRHFGDVSSPS
ncbi:hybrid sensor histidine kinase/response regulator [Variovorax sp. VRV01]|uniref:hybrid sensor histidine kinase/response regulator n=1 Tax=Variovorax sp. VRV01 TaxID=2769259 RepID=UPI00177DF194|nr:hybrid sensor histidine kinase/response regulator [Variovorax sp. VRV01]MBD9665661.1 hybrid sensor histidine kinase/response regulator [Variovorax sp. VRV01]